MEGEGYKLCNLDEIIANEATGGNCCSTEADAAGYKGLLFIVRNGVFVTGDTYLYVQPKKKVFDPSDPDTYYKVKSGDTLGRIAARKGTTVKNLCKLNGITTQTTLRIGQVLRLY